jgi:nitrate/nitrite-specific signal transduction histidine kinase
LRLPTSPSEKRAEEALNRLNEELEERVRERTAELEEKNRELERLNRLFVGRELKLIELKKRIKELEGKVA